MTTIEIIMPPGATRPIFAVDGEPGGVHRLEWRQALDEPNRIWVNGHRSPDGVRLVVRGILVLADLGTVATPWPEEEGR